MLTQTITGSFAGGQSARNHRAVGVARQRETSDEALVRAIAGGERDAMAALYSRHNVRLYRFIVRLIGNAATAEDLVNEVFLDVWRSAARFEGKSSVPTWLLAMARYKALSLMRRRVDEPLDERADRED